MGWPPARPIGQTLARADNRKVANEPLPVAKAKFSAIFRVCAFSAHIFRNFASRMGNTLVF
jgi:hypothetical protein